MTPPHERPRHLGLAGERCPVCGEPIETLLNNEGRNPMRCCWKCEVERVAKEEEMWEAYYNSLVDQTKE
jgi:hypothetical protein